MSTAASPLHPATFPATLRTSTPAEGHALAQRLAELVLAERHASWRDMADHLSAPPAPSVEALTVAYFQAVASANSGWPS